MTYQDQPVERESGLDRDRVREKKPSWWIRGLVIVVILVVATYIVVDTDMFQDQVGMEQRRRTDECQRAVLRSVGIYVAGGGRLGQWDAPQLLEALRKDAQARGMLASAPPGMIADDAIVDGFLQPMRVAVVPGTPAVLSIVSAGKDGKIGSKDDIVINGTFNPPATLPALKEFLE